GGTKDITANVRFVAATNRSLQEMVAAGTFRSDLFYRLSPFTISVPALKERKSDIKPLARHFLETRNFKRNVNKVFAPATTRMLAGYDWPGNVRELRNVVERAILVSAASPRILPEHISIPSSPAGTRPKVELSFDHEPTLEEIRDRYLLLLLETHDGNRQEVAKALGMSERNTYRLIKKLQAATSPS
ncbi:MAG TPA: sigma-54-dependent Fis family transcriptional regulator, partial [Rhizobiales bacterium]|nr:sigma-54-dependent Fis family transcriptional regulator [Hyphomicrobiales bacterium]